MTLEEGLQAYVSTKTAIAALAGTRVYPFNLPQNPTLPAITYQRISGQHTRSMGGSSQLGWGRVQFVFWATTYKAAKDGAEQLRIAMDGYAGAMSSLTVQSCFLEDEGDIFDDAAGTEQLRRYGARQDYMLSFTESAPTL